MLMNYCELKYLQLSFQVLEPKFICKILSKHLLQAPGLVILATKNKSILGMFMVEWMQGPVTPIR